MASKCPLSAILISLGIFLSMLAITVYFTLPSTALPPKYGEGWWGKGERRKPDTTNIENATIAIPDSVLDALRQRLARTRFFDSLEGIAWQYGTNQDYLRSLVDYWQNEYDWRKQEVILNSLPNYQTQIEGLRVHFWHLKPVLKKGQKLVPVLFIHGWPGSYFEFYKVIHILKAASMKSDGYVYEAVCPAIPGYGFSEAPHKPGFDGIDAARIFSKLMARLGHASYYVQGGDWGSFIGRAMAVIDRSHVRGLHLNMFPVLAPHGVWSYMMGYFTLPPKEHKKIFPLMDHVVDMLRESGYYHIQATRPDSVGLGLNDSPAGLAAYIIEKFMVCSGCQANQSSISCLYLHFTRDELVTNIMIYWVTNSITSSMRLYKENIDDKSAREYVKVAIHVPTGLAEFPLEVFPSPKPWLSSVFRNIIQHNQLPRGGHFAALEEPELLAEDLMEFVRKVETMAGSKTEL